MSLGLVYQSDNSGVAHRRNAHYVGIRFGLPEKLGTNTFVKLDRIASLTLSSCGTPSVFPDSPISPKHASPGDGIIVVTDMSDRAGQIDTRFVGTYAARI